MRHTPGPWRYDGRRVEAENGPQHICDCYGYPKTIEANVRLIAAAPEMLNALDRVLGTLLAIVAAVPSEPVEKEIRNIKQVIAKAEGAE